MNNTEIENLIKEIIEKTTISVNKISTNEDKPSTLNKDEDKTTWFSVEVSEPHFFWERGGEALFAINHLVRRIIESKIIKETEEANNTRNISIQGGLGVLVDINGFQKKHIENIHTIAHMMAERARYFKSNIEIDPMSAFERRVVHEFLSGATDLETESKGEGPSRRVVIKYTGTV